MAILAMVGYWEIQRGTRLLRYLDLNFGVKVDHSAVNMQTFVRVVDAVGGSTSHSSMQSRHHKPSLQAGLHHLDGTEALAGP
jgi:anionic cell wall polymer biosynthesis LytR-Cps2A-Psr (LCP) family protein